MKYSRVVSPSSDIKSAMIDFEEAFHLIKKWV